MAVGQMTVLTLVFCILGLSSPAVFSRDTDNALAAVTKIYIEIHDSENEAFNESGEGNLVLLLREQLSRRGYLVVNTSSEADAVLRGTLEVEVVLDGPDPPRYRYRYELTSPGYERLWSISVKTRNNLAPRENNRKAAARIVDKLDKAVKSAIKKIRRTYQHGDASLPALCAPGEICGNADELQFFM